MSIKTFLKFENNNTDTIGNYIPTNQGTPAYDNTIKHDDSYSFKSLNFSANYIKMPSQFETDMAGATTGWSMSIWAYLTSGKPYCVILKKRTAPNSVGSMYFYLTSSGSLDFWYNNSLKSISGFHTSGNWVNLGLSYDVANDTLKVYQTIGTTTTLKGTYTTAGNAFASNDGNFWIGGSTDSIATIQYLDNFLVSDTIETTFPIVISAPTITDISPLTGSVAGGTAVTITGTEFATGATVTFGGDSATDVVVVSATEITCVTPAHTAGAVDVVVTNTDTGTVTSAGGFTYVTPTVADIHFASAIYPQDFTVFLTDTNITNFQKEPYERNEELNVIDTFDFAFDKVTASAPLEFFKFLNNRAQNTLKIKNKSGNTIYIGKVSGVKSGMEINFANKSLFIESYPLIEDISTDFAIYNIAATNPIKIIKQLLDASVDAAYTVSKIHGLATVLSGISIAVNTDGEEENTKSIIQSICEAFNVGVYLEDLTVRAFAVQIFPDDATDITPYLVNLRPKFTNRGDLYADKIMLTYTPTLGGTEATITAGTGDTAKKMTISAPIFIDATSAGIAAERARAIYSQEFYEAELEADKTAMFKLGDTVKYPSELGDFICLIIGKNTTRDQITYKVLGVLK